MDEIVKIKDLKPDTKNFNNHSEFGTHLLRKSMEKFGGGRSIVLDKHNNIMAGNGVIEMSGELGLEDVQIVESDGRRIIAVKRTDLDLDTPEGREFALADNQVAAKNIVIDANLVEAVLGEAICEEWKVEDNTRNVSFKARDPNAEPAEWYLNIKFDNEKNCQTLFERLSREGFEVKIVT